MVDADAAGVAFAGVDGEPAAANWLRAAEGPGEEAADILTVVALAGGFGGGAGAEGALVDLDVAGVAEVGFDDVVERDAGSGPGGGGDGASGLTVEGPSEDGADVVAVVGLTGSLGARVKRALVDADVAVVAEVGFNDVVEGDAGGGPLGEGGGGEGEGGQERHSQQGGQAHWPTSEIGFIEPCSLGAWDVPRHPVVIPAGWCGRRRSPSTGQCR